MRQTEKVKGIPIETVMLVYNKTREFTCWIYPHGQSQTYAHIEAVIREKGILGMKGYFTAELEAEDCLRIKTGYVLAEQPW